MAVYICAVCDTPYDEDKEGVKWDDLPDNWICPVCDSPKSMFRRVEEAAGEASATAAAESKSDVEVEPAETIAPEMATVSDLMVDTMIKWGIKCVFGMVGHSNLGLADAIRNSDRAIKTPCSGYGGSICL